MRKCSTGAKVCGKRLWTTCLGTRLATTRAFARWYGLDVPHRHLVCLYVVQSIPRRPCSQSCCHCSPTHRDCDEHLLETAFQRATPLGSRFEGAAQVIGGAGGSSCSLLRVRPSAALCCTPVGLGCCSSSTRDEAAGARRKVLVVSARARSVMSYDCAIT